VTAISSFFASRHDGAEVHSAGPAGCATFFVDAALVASKAMGAALVSSETTRTASFAPLGAVSVSPASPALIPPSMSSPVATAAQVLSGPSASTDACELLLGEHMAAAALGRSKISGSALASPRQTGALVQSAEPTSCLSSSVDAALVASETMSAALVSSEKNEYCFIRCFGFFRAERPCFADGV
jgi:hypothetical protein